MIFRFSLYGFLKNQRYFEPFLMLVFLEQGLSFLTIGWLVATRELTVNLLEVPSGAIADSLGRRRSMIGSFVAYVASFLMFGLANHWWWFFPAMLLFGVGDSFRTGTHKAMIFEWLRIQGRSDDRTRVYGYTRSWSKIGSALSAILAAAFVIISGNYQTIFLFATIPCLINIGNFLGYPRELDGELVDSAGKSKVRIACRHLLDGLKIGLSTKGIRQLVAESMSWEGFFHATKDYLQPILAIVAAAWLGSLFGQSVSDTQQTALVIGITYAGIYFLSALASRNAHRVPDRFGSLSRASNVLWLTNAGLMLALLGFSLIHLPIAIAVIFMFVHVLQNIWRPILISRFDEQSEAKFGATMLSLESQAQRFATLALAPLVGWLVDLASNNREGISLWPLAAMGLALAVGMLMTRMLTGRRDVVEPAEVM